MIKYNGRKFDSINLFNYGKHGLFAHVLPIGSLTKILVIPTKTAVNVTFNNGPPIFIIHNDYGKKHTFFIDYDHTNGIINPIISAHRAQLLKLDP